MFFVLPMTYVLLIYVLAAVLPAAFLLRYVYKQDTVEKEPGYLLAALLGLGVLAALLSLLPEYLGEGILSAVVGTSGYEYKILLAFLVAGVVEEGAKFLLLYRRTWNDPNFNYRFDGIVYAVFVSLGFAAFENVRYVFSYGLSVAVPRALLAIPGHMSFAVVMGLFYGRARLCADLGNHAAAKRNLWAGWSAAVLLHGIYDSCAMVGTRTSTIIFVAFVAVMYFAVYRIIRTVSRTDRPV